MQEWWFPLEPHLILLFGLYKKQKCLEEWWWIPVNWIKSWLLQLQLVYQMWLRYLNRLTHLPISDLVNTIFSIPVQKVQQSNLLSASKIGKVIILLQGYINSQLCVTDFAGILIIFIFHNISFRSIILIIHNAGWTKWVGGDQYSGPVSKSWETNPTKNLRSSTSVKFLVVQWCGVCRFVPSRMKDKS